jgi:hypothetical protein
MVASVKNALWWTTDKFGDGVLYALDGKDL